MVYHGGVFSQETKLTPTINHWVEIIAEGAEGSTKYWVGRNSWGTSWGLGGFFKIQKGGNNLGI